MKRRYGYTTYIEWGLDHGKPYEKCIITPARKIDLEHDGFNYTCKCGSEGVEIFISKTIEEAIQKAHFNPEAIEFYRLNADEIKQKELFLSTLKGRIISSNLKKIHKKRREKDE